MSGSIAARTGQPILVGVDGGGTRCRARARWLDGTPIGECITGTANILAGIDEARDNIIAAVEGALAEGGLSKAELGRWPIRTATAPSPSSAPAPPMSCKRAASSSRSEAGASMSATRAAAPGSATWRSARQRSRMTRWSSRPG
ncbi:MAG: hypothetical protein J0H20_21835 [Rhizobiales bacterium]|nr:hypothetical protein [Hyphomicrobiales bacterium]